MMGFVVYHNDWFLATAGWFDSIEDANIFSLNEISEINAGGAFRWACPPTHFQMVEVIDGNLELIGEKRLMYQ